MSTVACSAAGCAEVIGTEDTTERQARMMARQAGWTAVTRAPFRCPTHRRQALNEMRARNGLPPLPAEA